MSGTSDASTIRRLVRFSDAVRDAVQNPRTFALTADDVALLTRIAERTDQEIAKARKL